MPSHAFQLAANRHNRDDERRQNMQQAMPQEAVAGVAQGDDWTRAGRNNRKSRFSNPADGTKRPAPKNPLKNAP
jgi:hypothetical protein